MRRSEGNIWKEGNDLTVTKHFKGILGAGFLHLEQENVINAYVAYNFQISIFHISIFFYYRTYLEGSGEIVDVLIF